MTTDTLQNKSAPSQEVSGNRSQPLSNKNDQGTQTAREEPQFQAPQSKGELKPGLYLIATPIGNLRDITFRALDTLTSADLVLCEDTRVTGKLLKAYGFKKSMQVYNDHSTDHQRQSVIEAVRQGQAVAVLSDAGTPLISDPGYKLVRLAIENDLYVTSLPGPNAALSGVQLSGLPTNQFSFLGFLPPKSGARISALQSWSSVPGSLVIYETGPRLIESLKDMKQVLGNREVAVTRELTKMYEEVKRGTIESVAQMYEDHGAPKGEIVVVIGPPKEEVISSESLEEQIKTALETMSVRDAAEMVAKATGKPKRAIYTLALKLSSK